MCIFYVYGRLMGSAVLVNWWLWNAGVGLWHMGSSSPPPPTARTARVKMSPFNTGFNRWVL